MNVHLCANYEFDMCSFREVGKLGFLSMGESSASDLKRKWFNLIYRDKISSKKDLDVICSKYKKCQKNLVICYNDTQ